VVATATAILILEEDGRPALDDEIHRFLPDFETPDKRHITVEDLLWHTSGLPAGIPLVDGEAFEDYLRRIAAVSLLWPPRSVTVYSNLGPIRLGRIVELVTKTSLVEFFAARIFGPLGIRETCFLVTEDARGRCAPTGGTGTCVPHDPKARRFYPRALGHPGLFGTAGDLMRFADMILNGGSSGVVRLLKPETVRKMTTISVPQIRGLGWDLLSTFSHAPRGAVFTPGVSFGHTGTALWIDPALNGYYVFLGNRVLLGEDATARPYTEFPRTLATVLAQRFRDSSSTRETPR
jgi:CubicO group peptidase (beta-lactamase class C family)